MKRFTKFSLFLVGLIFLGTMVKAQDVNFLFTSTTPGDYFKSYTGGIAISSSASISSPSSVYYVNMNSTPSNAGSNYIEVKSTDTEIEKIQIFVTGNGDNKPLQPAFLGWSTNTISTTSADVVVVPPAQTVSGKTSATAVWFTCDLSSKNIKTVRFYRAVKGVTVTDPATDSKTTIGSGETLQFYGMKVWLKSTGPKVTAPTIASFEAAIGESNEKNVNIKGSDLTQPLSISVTGTGFSSTVTTISATEAMTTGGFNIPVAYAPTSSSNLNGTLTISSSELESDVTVPLTGIITLPKPNNIVATNTTYGVLNLTWDAVEGATSYQVKYYVSAPWIETFDGITSESAAKNSNFDHSSAFMKTDMSGRYSPTYGNESGTIYLSGSRFFVEADGTKNIKITIRAKDGGTGTAGVLRVYKKSSTSSGDEVTPNFTVTNDFVDYTWTISANSLTKQSNGLYYFQPRVESGKAVIIDKITVEYTKEETVNTNNTELNISDLIPGCTYSIQIAATGGSTATITSKTASYYILDKTAINGNIVMSPISDKYIENSTIVLSATPNFGYLFDRWTGENADEIDNNGNLVMDDHKIVSAIFNPVKTTAEKTTISSNSGILVTWEVPSATKYDVSFTSTSNINIIWGSELSSGAARILPELRSTNSDINETNTTETFALVQGDNNTSFNYTVTAYNGSNSFVVANNMEGIFTATGINNTSTSAEIASTKFYTLTGVEINEAAAQGIVIVKTTYTDGSVKTSKIVK